MDLKTSQFKMSLFDKLPFELKEQILIYADNYDNIVKVSKEWRTLVKSSKRILQKVLDKYYFFFLIWSLESDWNENHPFHLFVYPICSEGDLDFFLQNGETERSQVGALEKTGCNIVQGLHDKLTGKDFPNPFTKRYNKAFYFNNTGPSDIGNTQTLKKRIEEFGSEALSNYIEETTKFKHGWGCELIPKGKREQDFFLEPVTPKGPKFSNKKRMFNLLQGVHLATPVPPLYAGQKFIPAYGYISLKNYDEITKIIERFKKEFENELFALEKIIFISTIFSFLNKSLFKPRWLNILNKGSKELSPAEYERILLCGKSPR